MTFIALLFMSAALWAAEPASPRVIEILADHDSRFKMAGQSTPSVTLKPGEQVVLRITARKAKTWNRDGAVHGFTLLRKDRTRVPGWNLALQPGTRDFEMTAPVETGEYIVLCTVICSDEHEGMNMKLFVVP
jgi:heme/copper-type cytochrome/quinol oxidase subunit 2